MAVYPDAPTRRLEFTDVDGKAIVPTKAQEEICAHLLSCVDDMRWFGLGKNNLWRHPNQRTNNAHAMVGYPVGAEVELATALAIATLQLVMPEFTVAVISVNPTRMMETVQRLAGSRSADLGTTFACGEIKNGIGRLHIGPTEKRGPWFLSRDCENVRGLQANILIVDDLIAVSDRMFFDTIGPALVSGTKSAFVALVPEQPGSSSGLWAHEMSLEYVRVSDDGR